VRAIWASWLVEFSTGYNMSDNDLERARELIAEAVGQVAELYLAKLQVSQSYFVPKPSGERSR
jgi:hypothetical protein